MKPWKVAAFIAIAYAATSEPAHPQPTPKPQGEVEELGSAGWGWTPNEITGHGVLARRYLGRCIQQAETDYCRAIRKEMTLRLKRGSEELFRERGETLELFLKGKMRGS